MSSGRKCAVCGAVPAGLQFIQVDIFRGDDECIATCNLCRKTRKEEVMRKAASNG